MMKSTINFGYLIFLSVVAAVGGFLFGYDMPIRFLPIKFDKLRMKLEAAKRAGYDKAITFEFSHFMSPQSAYLQAGHLYDRYKEYFEIK